MIDQARVRVGQWKSSLVDNPPLLDLDETSSLTLPGVEPTELVASLVGGAAFAFEAGVEGSVSTGWLRIAVPTPELERRLSRIRRAASRELAESGAHTLWLALGLLAWTDGEQTTRHAPLALLPVELERASGGGVRLVAIEDGTPRINDVLVEKLREAFDLVIMGILNPWGAQLYRHPGHIHLFFIFTT